MSFTEYIKIKNQKTEIKGLAHELREAIFNSKDASEVHTRLKGLEAKARQYWLDIERKEIEAYMQYGTLPFMIALNNEAMVYDQIKKTLRACY